jgi:hypothetical protein
MNCRLETCLPCRGCVITLEYIIPDESAGWRRRSETEDRRDELSEANP